MNLELLDPFRRQIPDRVDATLSLPSRLFGTKKSDGEPSAKKRRGSDASSSQATSPRQQEEEHSEDKAAYSVAFNRRGTYLVVGHSSGAVAVHDWLSRTISAMYRPEIPSDSNEAISYPYGVTSATWSRRSRTILAGAVGDRHVRLIDTMDPLGPEECSATPATEAPEASESSQRAVTIKRVRLFDTDATSKQNFVKEVRLVSTAVYSAGAPRGSKRESPSAVRNTAEMDDEDTSEPKKYPILAFSLPQPLGGSLQVHPRKPMAGLAVLDNGTLMLFFTTPSSGDDVWKSTCTPSVATVTLNEGNSITCAVFDPHGDRIYAASKDGKLFGFDIRKVMQGLENNERIDPSSTIQFKLHVPGGATVWHLIVSRNGRKLLLNCADGALRLYDAQDCWEAEPSDDIRPAKVFQDVVSKTPFASCDFSGDAEYIVGGCNANDDKYMLFLWNATTGALMDRLTGAQVSLNCVAWHPTRSFVAVATSDGLVDIWGPRMDWTAFAPDFQALPMNIEYIEAEDEFDIVDDKKEEDEEKEDTEVNVVKVAPVPVFASDSESESEVFAFETKINNVMGSGKRGGATNTGWATGVTGRGSNEEL